MKRWCKRPPASPETGAARQAPPGATPIGAMTRPAELQVGGNEPAGDDRPRWMAAPDRIPLTDRLKESPALQGFPIQRGGPGITRASRLRLRMVISGSGAHARTAWLRGSVWTVLAGRKAVAYNVDGSRWADSQTCLELRSGAPPRSVLGPKRTSMVRNGSTVRVR